jgi:hypothetical protein
MNKILAAVDLGIRSVKQKDHIVEFTSYDAANWLTPERKKEVEKKYNAEFGTGSLRFIVDKITAETI